MKRALVSVTNKEGIVEFCKGLVDLGFEIVSTGGTLKKLNDEGVKAIPIDDVTKFPEYKRAKYIGRVFQDPLRGTAGDMWIEENLAFALRRGKNRSFRWGISNKEREQFVELLKTLDLGLEDRLSSKVGLLSGGQRQALTLLMATIK